MDWKGWFKNHVSLSFWGMSTTRHKETGRILGMESYQYSDHTEEMYQAFKARMAEEFSLGATIKSESRFPEGSSISQEKP